MHYLLTFRSLTYAQRAERILERAGVAGTVSRVPKAAATRGCAYCVTVAARHIARCLDVLRAAGLSPERVLLRRADGSLEADHDLS